MKSEKCSDLDFEEGARGIFYNNAVINCKFGPRIVGTPAADTAHLMYGNNYQYTDSVSVANQFFPVGYLTKPRTTDYPLPSSYLPSGYQPGTKYDGTNAVAKLNPLFLNYPLPSAPGIKLRDIASVSQFNFRLQPTSPLIGKGYTGFTPMKMVVEDPIFGVSEYTQPGKDLGAYQYNGVGNQH